MDGEGDESGALAMSSTPGTGERTPGTLSAAISRLVVRLFAE
jgi:hypothetical protein